jgi:toxin ParE1/3/4
MKIIVTSFFTHDLTLTYQWYDAQRSGLGDALVAEIEKVFDVISQYPYASKKGRKYRSAFLSKFPYGIVYEVK